MRYIDQSHMIVNDPLVAAELKRLRAKVEAQAATIAECSQNLTALKERTALLESLLEKWMARHDLTPEERDQLAWDTNDAVFLT